MFSEFLTRTLTRASTEGGCGMSTRPEFYSGRGATTTDLSDKKLEVLWSAIRMARGDAAAEAFVCMVEAIPVLSATDFLISLAQLEGRKFVWSPKLLSKARGIYAADLGSAWATINEGLSGSLQRDETPSIRNEFLRRHGREVEDVWPSVYGYNNYDDRVGRVAKNGGGKKRNAKTGH